METQISIQLIKSMLQPRKKDAHKGNFGHALIIAGSKGKIGAAVLASRACLRSGVGLLTTHIPFSGINILQTTIPEAMLSIDTDESHFTNDIDISKYSTVSFGPGLGTSNETQAAIHKLISASKLPMVVDADGLNCLSLNKQWLNLIPENSILTPHPKEFERLVGSWKDDSEKMEKLKDFSIKHTCIVVLKGANTVISNSKGETFTNTNGNPGMAKGGSGDVLTGMITAFLAQSYSPNDAAILGVYIHGLAGDIAVLEKTEYGLLASDLIEYIPNAFLKITS